MRFVPFIVLCLLGWSCATLDEVENEGGAQTAQSQVVLDSPEVHSVQIHAGENETSLPIVELGSGLSLRLAFDLVETDSRPLSVYLYHADRNWKPDLSPSEVLSGFHNDTIQDYGSSGATVIPYVHYEYRFPNRSIDFNVSGNYILRVSEQGREEDSLFERRFYVTEQATSVEMNLDLIMVPGRRASSIRPLVRFQPPFANSNAFDYAVCFVRNAALESPACIDRPTLDVLPDLAFITDRENSFDPAPANFFIDLSELRTGGRLERVNQQPIPWRVEIEPDNARLPGTQLAPFINGKTVIRSANRYVNEPEYSSEYMNAVFRFIPPDAQPIQERISLIGSFNNWTPSSRYELLWDELNSWYEGRVLLKQGHYEYSYYSRDPGITLAMEAGLPQIRNMYTALVYHHDLFTQSDRIIAVQSLMTE